jgi:uncharacterized protein YcsI (UPF0317 family)
VIHLAVGSLAPNSNVSSRAKCQVDGLLDRKSFAILSNCCQRRFRDTFAFAITYQHSDDQPQGEPRNERPMQMLKSSQMGQPSSHQTDSSTHNSRANLPNGFTLQERKITCASDDVEKDWGFLNIFFFIFE